MTIIKGECCFAAKVDRLCYTGYTARIRLQSEVFPLARHLFLTGPTGSGKSTLLRAALGNSLRQAGGFVTEAVCGPHGELDGLALSPAAAAGGVSGFEAARFLDCRSFPPRTDNEVFRLTGVRLLQEATWYPFVLLDEIGGFELIIPQFRTALYELLRAELPIIGALKTPEEAEAMRQALGLGDKFCRYEDELLRFLRQDKDTQILDVRTRSDAAAVEILTRWKQEQLG